MTPEDDEPLRLRLGARRSFTDLAINTIAGVDSVSGIQSILQTHDRGYFFTSAQLADAMMRDDRISGVLKTRVGALLASPVEVKPANASAKAKIAADLIGGSDDEAGLWERIFPSEVVGALSSWGNKLGFGLAEIVWDTNARMREWTTIAPGVQLASKRERVAWLPRLKIWHPQFVYWDWAEMRYVLLTAEGLVRLPRVDSQPYSDGKWVIYTPYGYQYGWLDGLIRPLADKYLMRGWDYRDWARYNERHGMPIIKGKYPADSDATLKSKFQNDLSNIASDAVIGLPQLPKDKGSFDVEYEEAEAKTHETFQLFKKELDVDIAVAVLGQNLTTEGGTDGGSRALGQIQNLIRIDKALEDARIANVLRDQVLTHWAFYNFGTPDLAPRPSFAVEPPEDEGKEGAALKAIGDGIQSLKLAGAPVDERAILDRFGVPMLSEEEQAAREAVEAEEAAAAAGNNGGASGNDDNEGGPPKKKTAQLSSRLPQPTPVKRYEFQGLPIAVEHPAGSTRIWREPGPEGGVIGSTKMVHDYGFIEGHVGTDDEELDAYVGPDANARDVHVVHQGKAPDFKAHDEDKVMLGFPSADAARAGYVAHRNDGDRAILGMSVIPVDQFKRKLKRRTGTGKIRATADIDVTVAIMRLAQRAEHQVELRAQRSPAGQRRAKLYADRLADRAKQLAARALAVDLVGLKAEIDAASDWDDLRARIVRKFKGMDPQRLARVVEKTRLMANLGGRLSAVQDI